MAKPMLSSLSLALALTICGQAAATTKAEVQPDGSIKLLQDGAFIGSISFDSMNTSYTFAKHTNTDFNSAKNAILAAMSATSTMQARSGATATPLDGAWTDGVVTGTRSVQNVDGKVIVKFTVLTPRSANFAFVGPRVILDPGVWAGAKYSTDQHAGYSLPYFLQSGAFPSSRGSAMTFARPGHSITIKGTESMNVRGQDSRQWVPEFDFRIYPSGSLNWRAGEVREVSIEIGSTDGAYAGTPDQLVIGPSSEWLPLRAALDVVPGSILDMDSGAAPTGTYGWMKSNADGHFQFEKKDTPDRFYGANVLFGATRATPALSEILANRIDRVGYNAVRLHNFDDGVVRAGATSSDQLDMDVQNRMSYFLNALGKRGIYVWLDLMANRLPPAAELDFPTENVDDYKSLMLISDKAKVSWAKYAMALMGTKNPYNGKAWKDDPTIAWVCMQNESYLRGNWPQMSATSKAMFQAKWAAEGNPGTFDPTTAAGARWASQLHRNLYAWQKAKMKGIGVKALLSDGNGKQEDNALRGLWGDVDVVDVHSYWDHPVFLGNSWDLPAKGADGRRTLLNNGFLGKAAIQKQANKPFVLSEIGVSSTNAFRAEQLLGITSAASTQGWDAAFRFQFCTDIHRITQLKPMTDFMVQDDPIALACDRIGSQAFLRRDLGDEGTALVRRMTSADLPNENLTSPFQPTPYTAAVAWSNSIGTTTPTLPSFDGTFRNADNSVRFQPAANVMAIDTDRYAAGVANPNQSIDTAVMDVKVLDSRATIAAISRDGKALRNSSRILLSHLTDVQNTGETYSGDDRTVVTAWGQLPYLAKAGAANVTLSTSLAASLNVYRLDMAGNRIGQLNVSRNSRSISFTMDNNGPQGATLYDEVAP